MTAEATSHPASTSLPASEAPTFRPSAPPEAPTNDKSPVWSLPRRIAFRFVFTHFAILFFPAPVTSLLPMVGEVVDDFMANAMWLRIVRVVANHVLHVPGELQYEVTGSGDKLFDYVQLFTSLCLAAIITSVWSIAQRHRKEYAALESVFRIWLRYTLAAIMLSYGAVKVIKLQFPTPTPIQLIKTYGDSSPMNLLWTFMGFSTAYTFFAGFMEVLPALLLFFRRTALLGSLLLMAVLSNVVMLNFCYDVPVKLFSLHLLVMSVLVALPDVPRLVRFFWQGALTEPVLKRKPFEKRWMERTRLLAKWVFIVATLGTQVYGVWTQVHEYGFLARKQPLQGVYEVDSFVRGGVEVPALLTDATRLRYFSLRAFDDKRFVTFSMMNGERKFFNAKVDPERRTIFLEGPELGDEKPPAYTIQYSERDSGMLEFEGRFEGTAIRVSLHKIEPNKFLLMNRGFHWVNEVPFNR